MTTTTSIPYNKDNNNSETLRVWTKPSRWTTELKIKESKKSDNYYDIARELKNCETYEWQW